MSKQRREAGRWRGGGRAGSWAAAAAVAVSGCVAIEAPPEDLATRQITAPEAFTAADPGAHAAEPAPDGWLATFGSPVLVALAEEAMAHNPDLQQAAAAWEEARARVGVARSFLLPQLGVSAGAERARSGLGGAGGARTETISSVAAVANWELDLWGRLRSDTEAARLFADAVGFEYAFARHSLASAVADAWFLAIQAREQLAIDLDRLAAEQRTATVTADIVETGVGGQLEAELADSNVALAAEAVARDEAAIQELTRALEALLGRYPAAELAVADGLPPLPGPTPVGVPSALLERRPDIIAADRRVAAAFYGVSSARAARLPQVTLSASLGSLLDPSETIWSLGANLLAPVFTGGRLEAQVEVATAQQRQALGAYVAVAIDAFQEVETALANEGYLARRQAELETATARMHNASRISEDRYNAGIMSIVDLMTIRRQDFESRSQLLRIRTDRLRERLALYRALGGTFHTTDPATAPTADGGTPAAPQDQTDE